MNEDLFACYLMVEAMAVQATVEGMKAENQHRLQVDGVISYGEDDFERESATLHSLAEALHQRAG